MTEEHRITWILAGARYPNLGVEHHFLALDEIGGTIGIVSQVEHGSESGQWTWSMTRVHPGPSLNVPRNGTCETRGEAERELVAAWCWFREYYGLDE